MRWLLVWLGILGPLSAFAVESPRCEIRVDGTSYSLNEVVTPQRDLKKLFGFLKSFETSEETANEISSRLKSFDLSVRPFYSREDLAPNAVAFFDLHGTSIYLKSSELGTLAVLFFHEMVHALDEKYALEITAWESKSSPDDAQKDQIVFAAERKAYDQQRAFIEEIYAASPDCAQKYFTFHEEQKNIVARVVSDKDLAKHYASKAK